jgi:hypothetical protein
LLLNFNILTMKTVKKSKFSLEKFEVAKLKNSTMRKIVGGVGDGGAGNDNTIGSRSCNQDTSLRIG